MNVHLFDWVVVVSGGGEVRGVEEGVESIPFSQCYTYDSPTSHPFFFFFFYSMPQPHICMQIPSLMHITFLA